MNIRVNKELVDHVVRGVMQQLALGNHASHAGSPRERKTAVVDCPSKRHGQMAYQVLSGVITADVIDQFRTSSQLIQLADHAIVTPSGRDAIRRHGLRVIVQGRAPSPVRSKTHVLIVQNSITGLQSLVRELAGHWQIEWLEDECQIMSYLASELARGSHHQYAILSRTPRRLACVLNRHQRVYAVVTNDISDVLEEESEAIEEFNTWCINLTGRTWYSLLPILRRIRTQESPAATASLSAVERSERRRG